MFFKSQSNRRSPLILQNSSKDHFLSGTTSRSHCSGCPTPVLWHSDTHFQTEWEDRRMGIINPPSPLHHHERHPRAIGGTHRAYNKRKDKVKKINSKSICWGEKLIYCCEQSVQNCKTERPSVAQYGLSIIYRWEWGLQQFKAVLGSVSLWKKECRIVIIEQNFLWIASSDVSCPPVCGFRNI